MRPDQGTFEDSLGFILVLCFDFVCLNWSILGVAEEIVIFFQQFFLVARVAYVINDGLVGRCLL